MGGKKKPTISQLVKREERQKEAAEKKGKERGKVVEEATKKNVYNISQELLNQIMSDVSKMDYVTTYVVASKYGLKMTIASRILNDLYRKGELVLVDKGHRTAIYVPKDKAAKLGLLNQ